MAYHIKPGKDLQASSADEPQSVDDIAIDLLEELISRIGDLAEFQSYLEAGPLGNEFEPDEEQQFNGMEQLRDMSRNNFAKLIVDATSDRLGIMGFRTAGSTGENGDLEAMNLFERDGMDSRVQEALSMACGYRNAYLLVDPASKRQMVVPPTNAAVVNDNLGEPVAAITIHRDRALQRQVLRVYTRSVNNLTGEAEGPVQMFVATKEDKRFRNLFRDGLKLTRYDSEVELDRSIRNGWTWWREKSPDISRIPVTPLTNRDGRNEFELHQPVITRINHMIYQRVVIATMQAFRQRAIKGEFPERNERGEKIDYDEMFEAGPARLWLLPEGAEMWESQQTSFQDILLSVKDDLKDLASATYTPMNYFSDSVNNSAEGAALQRENYLSKIEDRKRRFGAGLKRHQSIVFEANGMQDRADERSIEVIWTPTNVYSLNERTQGYGTLIQNGIARETAMREALGWTPKQIKRANQDKTKETLSAKLTESVSSATPMQKASATGITAQRSEGDDS